MRLKIFTLAVFSFLLWQGASPVAAEPGLASTEAPAPNRLWELSFPDLQGNQVTLARWRGQALLVNFWATWCAPCREELPVLSRLHTEFQGEKVQFVGIALDSAANVQAFADKNPLSFPLLVDAEQAAMVLFPALGNPAVGVPFTVLLDGEGRIVARQVGRLPEAQLVLWLRRLP
ncbi:MAG: TlpA family protein disulfide reductase [Zoogloeaceae bacterium]|jgi:peroxiredoxin|nr:TlpA family protein disulfide reductase [Zoogloeaceae bacterium]